MKRLNIFNIALVLIILASTLHLKAQVPENGLVFDGTDDYVSVISNSGDELNPDFNLTVECWVNLNVAASATHRPHLVTRMGSYGLVVETSGYARLFLYTNGWISTPFTASTLINPNQWYHLSATFDGVTGRLYVNGAEEASVFVDDTLNHNSENVRIGSVDMTPNIDNTNGMIDEVRIWNVTRSQTQIQNSMNRTIPGSTAGLVGYWRFDETSGTNANDQTSNNNDGTLTNMSTPAAWQTSTAPIGETSIFAVSSDITETSECDVDVDFAAADGPGLNHSLAVMQVNQTPNSVTGLYPDRASQYWEIWSEDPDFDGNFTVDVRFHYDDINGLPTESAIELFRRDDANDTWATATGYTVVTNDGGSSTTTDGNGYVELTITETTPGDFSGQYILSWDNQPPVVSDIPNQSVAEGSAFATIALDNFVSDPDNADSEITWTATSDDDVTVVITNRVATITANDLDWNGTDIVTFTAEDPDGETDSDQVTFEVTPVNDLPVVGNIPGETVAEGTAFATINLDNYVTDIDNVITSMTWTSTGESNLSVDITGRVATITANDVNWNGSETITFQAEDPAGETDSDPATFTVTPVNDAPVIDIILNQTIAEGESFTPVVLDDYVLDVDDADNTLTWTTADEVNVSIDITDRIATITVNDPEWSGSERVTFTVEDPGGLSDFVHIRFNVIGDNDNPVVADIPDQTIAEGQSFSQLNLDDYVADADDPDSIITWTVSASPNLIVGIADRVATISVNDEEWNGSDTLIFTATDTAGASATDTSIFTVTAINDAPTVEKAIPDTVAVAETAFTLVLDPNTFADVDQGDILVLSASMSMGGSTPTWLTFTPATGTFSGTPADGDKGLMEVIVTATDNSSASVSDTFNIDVESYVGISNPLEGLEINLYPNPNNGRFVIESDIFELKDVVLEIFNEKGQLIWNREIRNEIGTLHESVDLDNAAEGLYLLRMRNRSGVINKRFVISY
jgi:hypothetical protein